MSTQNIFGDEWRACLHAHYLDVLQKKDMRNEESLRSVLLQVGFTESELAAIREGVPRPATSDPAAAPPEPGGDMSDQPSQPKKAEEDLALAKLTEELAAVAAETAEAETGAAVEPPAEEPDADKPQDQPQEPPTATQLSLF